MLMLRLTFTHHHVRIKFSHCRPDYEFDLHDNILTRVTAAFRGGMGYSILYQTILFTIPVLRLSRKIALFWSLYLFQHFLPSTQKDDDFCKFTANLQPGYKQNTKLIFNDERTGQTGVEVHFVLKEAKHPTYRRIGTNLHVSCTISPKQAAEGCQVQIPSLHDEDFLLSVSIPRHITSGDSITVPGKGWPSRKQKGVKGDLIVTVVVSRFTHKSAL